VVLDGVGVVFFEGVVGVGLVIAFVGVEAVGVEAV
jgi:hypothetical protein